MKIAESDFELIQPNESAHYWDLYLLKTIKPKIGPEREELTLDAYGVPLDLAIRKIAAFRMNKRYDSLTMKEYLKNYREIIDDLTERCRVMPIDPDVTDSNV